MNTREVGIAVVAIAIVHVAAEGDVTSVAVHASIELDLSTQVAVVAPAQRLVLSAVDHQTVVVQFTESLVAQWVEHIFIGVGIERS